MELLKLIEKTCRPYEMVEVDKKRTYEMVAV